KIVTTWAECAKYVQNLKNVKGAKGAVYKSFPDLDSAKQYLQDDKKLLKKGVDDYPMDCLHLYVDGSYNKDIAKYSYSFVAVQDNIIVNLEHGTPKDNSQKQLRQIPGELEAAVKSVSYAINSGHKKVVVLHDYEGIYHHAIGTWERNDESSKKYY